MKIFLVIILLAFILLDSPFVSARATGFDDSDWLKSLQNEHSNQQLIKRKGQAGKPDWWTSSSPFSSFPFVFSRLGETCLHANDRWRRARLSPPCRRTPFFVGREMNPIAVFFCSFRDKQQWMIDWKGERRRRNKIKDKIYLSYKKKKKRRRKIASVCVCVTVQLRCLPIYSNCAWSEERKKKHKFDVESWAASDLFLANEESPAEWRFVFIEIRRNRT